MATPSSGGNGNHRSRHQQKLWQWKCARINLRVRNGSNKTKRWEDQVTDGNAK